MGGKGVLDARFSSQIGFSYSAPCRMKSQPVNSWVLSIDGPRD